MVVHTESPCLLRSGFFYYPATLDLESAAEVDSLQDQDSMEFDGLKTPLYRGESLLQHVEFLADTNALMFAEGVQRKVLKFLKSLRSKRENPSDSILAEEKLASTSILGVMPRFVSFHKKAAIEDTIRGKAFEKDRFIDFLKGQFTREEQAAYEDSLRRARDFNNSDGTVDKLLRLDYKDPWKNLTDILDRNGALTKKDKIEALLRGERLRQTVESSEPILFIDGNKVYVLDKKSVGSSTIFRLSNELYYLGARKDINFANFLEGSIENLLVSRKRESVFQEASRQLATEASTRTERLALSLFMREVGSLEKEDFGVVRNNDSYLVYLKLPEYALINDKKETYLFKSCRVGVHLTARIESKTINCGSPFVIGSYSHPFLSGNAANQTICIGNYDYKSKAGTLERVVEALSIGKQVMLEGYNSSSRVMTPYRKLDRGNFAGSLIDPKSLKSRGGLGITNK